MRFLQLGSLLETDPIAASLASLNAVVAIMALLSSVLLLVSAFLSKRENQSAVPRTTEEDIEEAGAPTLKVTTAVGVLVALSILAFAYAASTILPERDTGPVVRLVFYLSL